MLEVFKHPTAIFVISLILQWAAAYLGHLLRKRAKPLVDAERADFNTVLGATLTLLALIIGFSFSMAVSRYDERKNDEEREANAIGMEYVRASLLPPADAVRVRGLLAAYAEQRIQFYEVDDPSRLAQIDAATVRLRSELWSAVAQATPQQPTPFFVLVAGGMNEVLNTQGFTQAAWWNRIPVGAWGMMFVVAFAANFLLGASEQRRTTLLLVALPLIVSAPIFLIADIDEPRAGLIYVSPDNLIALSHVMEAHP
jgi:hypothetical protein